MDETNNGETPFDPFQGGIGRLVGGWSAHDAILKELKTMRRLEVSDILKVRGSANLDFAIGDELVGRHRQVGRRRPLADTPRGVVLRAVARAEEAVVIALMGD